MNQYNIIYNKVIFELKKYGISAVIEDKGLFNVGNRKVKIINSQPIISAIDGSLNGLELHGIGKYSITLEEVDIYIFTFENEKLGQIEYAILPIIDLLDRLHKMNKIKNGRINIRLWLTNEGQIMESFGYGSEGEFMALWLDKNRDFTEFYNNWSLIK